MGDNKSPIDTKNATLSYTYYTAGTYTVNVTVSYTDGFKDSAATTFTVAQGVSNNAPTPGPGSTSNPNSSTTPVTSTNPGTNDPTLTLPPTIIGIITVVTIFVLGGSVFWLRRQKNQ